MTLPRLYALSSYWKACPPVQESVAALLGVKPDASAADTDVRSYVGTMPKRTVEFPQ